MSFNLFASILPQGNKKEKKGPCSQDFKKYKHSFKSKKTQWPKKIKTVFDHILNLQPNHFKIESKQKTLSSLFMGFVLLAQFTSKFTPWAND